MGEAERGRSTPHVEVAYWCEQGHETRLKFVDDASVDPPAEWDCPRCGRPAGPDRAEPPSAARAEPYKTHLAYVKERRSDSEGAALLDERLEDLRGRGLIR